jgi:hypothetical protein
MRTSPRSAAVPSPVKVDACADGSLVYSIDLPPGALPPVVNRDLARAWAAARDAADASVWGTPRGFRFRSTDGEMSDVILADADAACWADAVDRRFSLHTSYGLSLCLRLLALVELLSRARQLSMFCSFHPDGAELHPALLSLAAQAPLSPELRFDATHFQASLGRLSDSKRHIAGASA